jgi:hypothetical protein
MQKPEVLLLARAIQIRDQVAAGRFLDVDSRFAANILGAWLQFAKERLEYEQLRRQGEVPPRDFLEDEPPDEEMVFWIERIYREIEHRLAAH